MTKQTHVSVVGFTGSYIREYHRCFTAAAAISQDLAERLIENAKERIVDPTPQQQDFRLNHNKVFMVIHADERLDLAVYSHDRKYDLCVFDKLGQLPDTIIRQAEAKKRAAIDAAAALRKSQCDPLWETKRAADEVTQDRIGRDLIEKGDDNAWKQFDAECSVTWKTYEKACVPYKEIERQATQTAKALFEEEIKPAFEWHFLAELPGLIAQQWEQFSTSEDAQENNRRCLSKETWIEHKDGRCNLMLRRLK